MATEATVAAGDIFIGEDKRLVFGPLTEDVAAWQLQWTLRKTDKAAEALIDKATGTGITIEGTFSATPASNTQRIVVTLSDDDTNLLKAIVYRHSLKRMGSGVETILSYGDFEMSQATVR